MGVLSEAAGADVRVHVEVQALADAVASCVARREDEHACGLPGVGEGAVVVAPHVVLRLPGEAAVGAEKPELSPMPMQTAAAVGPGLTATFTRPSVESPRPFVQVFGAVSIPRSRRRR